MRNIGQDFPVESDFTIDLEMRNGSEVVLHFEGRIEFLEQPIVDLKSVVGDRLDWMFVGEHPDVVQLIRDLG